MAKSYAIANDNFLTWQTINVFSLKAMKRLSDKAYLLLGLFIAFLLLLAAWQIINVAYIDSWRSGVNMERFDPNKLYLPNRG